MAGSASDLATTERVLHIGFEEPLPDTAVSDTNPHAHHFSRYPFARAFSSYEPCLFECPLKCVSAAVGGQCKSGTRAQPLFRGWNASYMYMNLYRRRFAAAAARVQRSDSHTQLASGR